MAEKMGDREKFYVRYPKIFPNGVFPSRRKNFSATEIYDLDIVGGYSANFLTSCRCDDLGFLFVCLRRPSTPNDGGVY